LPTAAQCKKGRAELLSTSFRDYERRVREQFMDLFSRSGFDAGRDIAGIILNRWGIILLPLSPDSCTERVASRRHARFCERNRLVELLLHTRILPVVRVTITPLRRATGP
jgi:hypothetical protein